MTPRALRGLSAAVPGCRGSPRAGGARCVFSWRWFPWLEQLVREQCGAGWQGWARGSAGVASFSPCRAGNMGRGGAER